MPRFASAVALGVLLGWTAAHFLSLQWWTLVPWGLAAVALGYRASMCFVFTLATYGGAAPAITRVPFFMILGLVGAVCGLLLALLGASLMPRPVPMESRSRDDAA